MKHSTHFLIVAIAFAFGLPAPVARAHCDTLSGPVVVAAKEALAAADVTPVMKWIQAGDEAEVRQAFERAVAVRRVSEPAAALADQWFFETLVRLHRAGEGVAYTGLRAETAAEPGIEAADHALQAGNIDSLTAATTAAVAAAIRGKFEHVQHLRAKADDSVESGRAYVAAYVEYIHFVARIAALADGAAGTSPAHHHD